MIYTSGKYLHMFDFFAKYQGIAAALPCPTGSSAPDEDTGVYYEAPDLSGGVEGVDYVIAYGAAPEEGGAED